MWLYRLKFSESIVCEEGDIHLQCVCVCLCVCVCVCVWETERDRKIWLWNKWRRLLLSFWRPLQFRIKLFDFYRKNISISRDINSAFKRHWRHMLIWPHEEFGQLSVKTWGDCVCGWSCQISIIIRFTPFWSPESMSLMSVNWLVLYAVSVSPYTLFFIRTMFFHSKPWCS